MSKQTDFGERFRRSITVGLPAQILMDYYFHTGSSRRSKVQPSGGDILIKGDCVARIEVGSDQQFRAVFLGDASSKHLWSECQTDAEGGSLDCTPWIPYEDRNYLAELIDSRIQLLL